MFAPSITLLTDFGLQDTYVGQMKGVIAGIAPAVNVIDLTHAIRPQHILHGAVALVDAVEAFPAGTIHIAIVDPGVGSDRRGIAAEIGPWRFVGPDNGLFTGVLERWPLHRAISLTNPQSFRPTVSHTFHGRDVFAPVAAHWATGRSMEEFGDAITEPLIRLDWPRPVIAANRMIGQVLMIDHYGNLITNILADQLPALTAVRIKAGGQIIGPVSRCYAEHVGEPLALIGSSGRLEIAVGDGSAAERLQLGIGDSIEVTW